MARRVAYLSAAVALVLAESTAADWPLAAALAEDDVCGRHDGTSTCALELAQLRSSVVPRRRKEDGEPFSDAFGDQMLATGDGEVPGGSLQAHPIPHHAKKEHHRDKRAKLTGQHGATVAGKHEGRAHRDTVLRDALGDEVRGVLAADVRAQGPEPTGIEKRMEDQAKRDEEKWAQQDANGRAAKVSCGGDDFVKSCDLCPRSHGAKWCHGECMWMGEACVQRTVSCGGEQRVKTCAQCPRGHYAHWCNGDCMWKNDTATCVDPLDGVGEPPSLRAAAEAAEVEETERAAEKALEERDATRTTTRRTTTTTTPSSTTQARDEAAEEVADLEAPARGGRGGLSCRTIGVGGTVAAGSDCVFPFVYKGHTNYECTKMDAVPEGQPWCSTTEAYKGLWGNCICD